MYYFVMYYIYIFSITDAQWHNLEADVLHCCVVQPAFLGFGNSLLGLERTSWYITCRAVKKILKGLRHF